MNKDKIAIIEDFVKYAAKRLKLKKIPKIKLLLGTEFVESERSLGAFDQETKMILIAVHGRLVADILRTVAHELTHRKQDELELIKSDAGGETGSSIENAANSVAGILLRDYGLINKDIYIE